MNVKFFHARSIRPRDFACSATFGAALYTTVEFLPFGFDWTHVAGIRLSENKGLYQPAKRITHPDCEDVGNIKDLPCDGWNCLSAGW
jgi:hypothetical protein